ncbi:hypothetical protein EJ08DRAFT_733908 [Tothia fuscella]|uniref:Uncharacterized protein n=1 Tax=Tothia fuscella TaxID=1048955 RepID=A0A9P4NSL0_9PEZI|nr:hypothetical protein EJ08DRAFT_733908 [Tothia fuscella]
MKQYCNEIESLGQQHEDFQHNSSDEGEDSLVSTDSEMTNVTDITMSSSPSAFVTASKEVQDNKMDTNDDEKALDEEDQDDAPMDDPEDPASECMDTLEDLSAIPTATEENSEMIIDGDIENLFGESDKDDMETDDTHPPVPSSSKPIVVLDLGLPMDLDSPAPPNPVVLPIQHFAPMPQQKALPPQQALPKGSFAQSLPSYNKLANAFRSALTSTNIIPGPSQIKHGESVERQSKNIALGQGMRDSRPMDQSFDKGKQMRSSGGGLAAMKKQSRLRRHFWEAQVAHINAKYVPKHGSEAELMEADPELAAWIFFESFPVKFPPKLLAELPKIVTVVPNNLFGNDLLWAYYGRFARPSLKLKTDLRYWGDRITDRYVTFMQNEKGMTKATAMHSNTTEFSDEHKAYGDIRLQRGEIRAGLFCAASVDEVDRDFNRYNNQVVLPAPSRRRKPVDPLRSLRYLRPSATKPKTGIPRIADTAVPALPVTAPAQPVITSLVLSSPEPPTISLTIEASASPPRAPSPPPRPQSPSAKRQRDEADAEVSATAYHKKTKLVAVPEPRVKGHAGSISPRSSSPIPWPVSSSHKRSGDDAGLVVNGKTKAPRIDKGN